MAAVNMGSKITVKRGKERTDSSLLTLICWSSTGQMGGEGESQEDKSEAEQAEQERLEALQEAEDRRKEKHRKLEEEREKMRQEIRDKYGIKKREEKEAEMNQAIAEGGLNRRKKTPAELAAEQEAEELDDFTSKSTICFKEDLMA
ncbi:complexin-like [Limulus polyphemus]|uniref:Complexin-like n=1 Tax=Limulus polyphemus TaxID=6850 RepID=A0ABM1C1B9_LIMPO|nr:complexin-like [Limulus polyphemus]